MAIAGQGWCDVGQMQGWGVRTVRGWSCAGLVRGLAACWAAQGLADAGVHGAAPMHLASPLPPDPPTQAAPALGVGTERKEWERKGRNGDGGGGGMVTENGEEVLVPSHLGTLPFSLRLGSVRCCIPMKHHPILCAHGGSRPVSEPHKWITLVLKIMYKTGYNRL
jgi:hypothetical protein